MSVVLPKATDQNKVILFFSGGRVSEFLASQLSEASGSLDNVICLFMPLTSIFRAKYELNNIQRKKAEEQLKTEIEDYRKSASKFAFGEVAEFTSYEDFNFKNGDNVIADRHRLDFYASIIDLIVEKGYDLNLATDIIIGINAESKVPDLYDLEELKTNKKVHMPFIEMTKAEVNAIVS